MLLPAALSPSIAMIMFLIGPKKRCDDIDIHSVFDLRAARTFAIFSLSLATYESDLSFLTRCCLTLGLCSVILMTVSSTAVSFSS